MSGAAAMLVLLLIAPVAGQADQSCVGDVPASEPGGAAPFVRADVRAIAEVITCYCGCPHLQVSQCFCGTADAIRADLAARLDRGETSEAIIAAYVAEHGVGVLAVPPRHGFHWIIWIGPPLLLLAGAIAILFTGRRWARAGRGPELTTEAIAPDVEARHRAALRRKVLGTE